MSHVLLPFQQNLRGVGPYWRRSQLVRPGFPLATPSVGVDRAGALELLLESSQDILRFLPISACDHDERHEAVGSNGHAVNRDRGVGSTCKGTVPVADR